MPLALNLVKRLRDIRVDLDVAAEARAERDELICQALLELGRPEGEIAEATGLSRGELAEILQEHGGDD